MSQMLLTSGILQQFSFLQKVVSVLPRLCLSPCGSVFFNRHGDKRGLKNVHQSVSYESSDFEQRVRLTIDEK